MVIIPVLIIIVIVVAVVFASYLFVATGGGPKPYKAWKNQDIKTALKEAEKCLAKNPHNADALAFIGDYQFQNGDWENAYKTYETLTEIPLPGEEIDGAQINLRAAICATNLNMLDGAFKYIVVAHSMSPSNFEITYNIGNIEFLRKNYEKAVMYLQQAYSMNPEYAPAVRLLGHAYFKLKRVKEAMTYIRKSIELAPKDKETLFTLAECYLEAGQKEQSERIYAHLRPDPVWGAEACLRSGLINVEYHQDDKAIADFEIGIKHKDIKPDIATELHYQLGSAYLRVQKIAEAISHLQIVQQSIQGYKDTDTLVAKYKEMNANKNMQIFIMAPASEFMALCRKIVLSYFPKAKVKITKTQITSNDWADIVAEVDTPKWSDVVMFRFIRTQGAIGEMVLRDFQSHLKDVKAGKGICMGVGVFSDEAKRFTETRLIDLIEKERVLPILKSLDSIKQPSTPPPPDPTSHSLLPI
ncbi:MAG: tetratricopeptide repeat protein [Spirochaetaceae bacterium]|jgi:tetratricopeptide (TPR) repeat protein|nr:tetratricopeptide repeat protein [Spirochaetaceae bacterium]